MKRKIESPQEEKQVKQLNGHGFKFPSSLDIFRLLATNHLQILSQARTKTSLSERVFDAEFRGMPNIRASFAYLLKWLQL